MLSFVGSAIFAVLYLGFSLLSVYRPTSLFKPFASCSHSLVGLSLLLYILGFTLLSVYNFLFKLPLPRVVLRWFVCRCCFIN